jgi:hypothetical protein
MTKVVDGYVERTLKVPADVYHDIRVVAAQKDTTIAEQIAAAMRHYVAWVRQEQKDKEEDTA